MKYKNIFLFFLISQTFTSIYSSASDLFDFEYDFSAHDEIKPIEELDLNAPDKLPASRTYPAKRQRNEGETMIQCTCCEHTSNSELTYIEHLKSEHPNHESLMFACYYPGCSRIFPTQKKLSSHNKTTHNKKIKFCSHPGCNKRLSNININLHRRSHTTGNQIKCTNINCGFSSNSQQLFDEHMATHLTPLVSRFNKASRDSILKKEKLNLSPIFLRSTESPRLESLAQSEPSSILSQEKNREQTPSVFAAPLILLDFFKQHSAYVPHSESTQEVLPSSANIQTHISEAEESFNEPVLSSSASILETTQEITSQEKTQNELSPDK